MNEYSSELPQAENADPDGVQLALRAAHTLWSRGDTTESLKWLRKAAESASDEGADLRSLQLAKAAAELRGKLFSSEPPRSASNEISGAHPIAPQSAPEPEPLRAAGGALTPSSPPPAVDVYGGPLGAEDAPVQPSSRAVVTATQYPSHRPRQRMGLTSSPPGALQRDGNGYTPVPSWSADSERRTSSAPPPLPRAMSLDDYEELEAEPDDEPADDPGSVWSGGSSESWRPTEASEITAEPGWHAAEVAAPPSALPPPLPPGGAFAEDEADYAQAPEPPTVVIASPEEPGSDPRSSRRQAASGFSAVGASWDQQQQPRSPSWDQDAGSSWAEELRNAAWSNASGLAAPPAEPSSGPEPPPPSDTTPAKLTARVHHQAVRVSFAPDLRVPGQYVVRPLREGEKAATGERIALLVALEPGVPLV